jgi:hypothetical protein
MRPDIEALSFLARPYLSDYTRRNKATTMSEPDKTFPFCILLVLPSRYNPGVRTVQVQIE